jgi:hypothetical protein
MRVAALGQIGHPRAAIASSPPSATSSGTLGVVSVASAIRRSNPAIVAGSASAAPLVAIITGSNTTGTLSASIRSATTSAMAGEPSIPILIASMPMSCAQASIWAATIAGSMATTALTPSVFWAVSAQIAVIAKPPSMVIVLMSA